MSVFQSKFASNFLEMLVLPLQEGLLEIPLLKPWSLQSHRFFPARFKGVARTVLLCASRASGDFQGERLLCHTSQDSDCWRSVKVSFAPAGLALAELPKDVVLKVIHHLAASYKSYLPYGAHRPTLSRQHYL